MFTTDSSCKHIIRFSLDVILRRKESFALSLFSAKSFEGRPEVKLLDPSTSILSEFSKFRRKLTPSNHVLFNLLNKQYNLLDKASVKFQIILFREKLFVRFEFPRTKHCAPLLKRSFLFKGH